MGGADQSRGAQRRVTTIVVSTAFAARSCFSGDIGYEN